MMKQEMVPMRDGYDIGIGVSMASGSPMALGATGMVTPPQVGGGETGSFTFRRIETTQELESELGVGADISAGIGLFSGSASLDFSKRCRVQSSSLTVMVSNSRAFAFKQMDSPELSKAASDLKKQGKPLEEQFGEYFVRGIGTGGRFFGVVRIDTKSVQSKMSVNAALEGSYGVTVSAEVRISISEAMRNAEARAEAFILHDGGTFTTQPRSGDPVTLLSDLYDAMDEWTKSVKDSPRAYTASLAPYAIALGPTPPNIADIEKQRRVLIRCAKLRSQSIDMLNLVDYVLDIRHTDEFEFAPDGPDLQVLRAALAGDLDVIEEAASFAIENLKEARDPEVYMRDIHGKADFRLTGLPANMPRQKEILPPVTPPPPAAPNAMPNLVGQLAEPAISLLACINMEGVDHCLNFVGARLDALGLDRRELGNFFFTVLRSGVIPDVRGDASRPGSRITSQSPAPGTPVQPMTTMTLVVT
ncbi:hypothetical protein [Streptomyces sp. NPDC088706]|uniref:hypothetical protein n=2 Tax=unclassified Streptomyces TaxID=2593676 RepID=UPI00382F6E76